MDKDRKATTVKKKAPPDMDEVREYLMLNPDFFDLNPDLLTLLKPSRIKHAGGVVDFQAVLLDRLQQEVAGLNKAQGSLIQASRSNMTTQARIHAAVLTLLEARGFDHLCHIAGNDWVDILQLDSITICFEKDNRRKLPESTNIRLLDPGVIGKFLGHETTALLRGDVTAAEEIHGPATPLIKAEALIRIEATDHYPGGILAFGSRDEGFFAPGQGTELLRFLTAVFQAQVKNLLP